MTRDDYRTGEGEAPAEPYRQIGNQMPAEGSSGASPVRRAAPIETGSSRVRLRNVTQGDLPIFFEQQQDPVANHMVAFTAKDSADRDAFMAKWGRILSDDAIAKRTVLFDGQVAGNVLSFVAPGSRSLEVGYWIGRDHWGQGVATQALSEFLRLVAARPLQARVAKDNVASLRVLEKCGFTITGEDKGFAEARGEEIEEFVLELKAYDPIGVTLDRLADLSDADREDLRRLTHAVYPPEQSGDWPGRHIEWSQPEWCVRIRNEDGILASFVGVSVREAECDGRPVRVGGVGNVKTHPGARGQGLATRGIERAIEFFRTQHAIDFALLVCEPRLLAYYGRSEWRELNGRLLIRQHGVPTEFTFNRVMTHAVQAEAPTAGTIDLCGPPW